MSNITQYIAFGVGLGANTYSYAAYAGSAQVGPGYAAGTADAQHVNTVLRQTTVGVAALAKFAADHGLHDVLDNGDHADFEVALRSAVNALIDAKLGWGPGDVKATLNNVVPSGWVPAYGQIVSRSGIYAALFSAYGTRFGAGDGTTTFQLPDLRGEFLRGWDDSRGVDPTSGRALGSAQSDAVQNATGTLGLITGGVLAGGAFAADGTPRDNIVSDVGGTNAGITFDLSRVVRTASETRPRNVAVLYLIKL